MKNIERLSIQELERMSDSSYVSTMHLNLIDEAAFGDDKKHKLEVDIFDGFAYCANFKGKEYYFTFPKKEFVKASKEMETTVRSFLNLKDDEEITEKHIFLAYETIYVNA